MKALIILPVFILVLGGARTNTTTKNNLKAHCVSDSLQGTILVINSFDAMSIKARKNKKDLFKELTDAISDYLSEEIKKQTEYTPVIITGILDTTNNLDSLVFSLMKENNAGKAILIRSLDTYFIDTESKVERNDDGKPITVTSYDMCVNNEYTLYDRNKILKQSVIKNCEFFTTRSFKGRFGISFGPDIVGKRKHTYKVVAYNANRYILEICPC
jgi:hypothetical protein